MKTFFLTYGFFCWFIATAALRLVGQYILIPGDETRALVVFALSVLLLLLITVPVYQWKRLNRTEQCFAGIYIAIPGQILDAVTTLYFDIAFPNMPTSTGNQFGAWMLWGYAVIILTGFFPMPRKFPSVIPIFATLLVVLFASAATGQANNKADEQNKRDELRDFRKKMKAYRKIAVYEGGIFGFNRNVSGIVERDFDRLAMRNEKNDELLLAIPYQSIVAVYVGSEGVSQRPDFVKNSTTNNPEYRFAYVSKAKNHRLFVHYRDPKTEVCGTATFRFERFEAAYSMLEQLIVELGMVKQNTVYVRRKFDDKSSAPTSTEEFKKP
ncbi:MAG: DUF5367 domain-containing protein [Pyrinomonadaceae bacterium]|nr:DUF5367 domain-containing protein [Pyrinomonadaceae bacterium]